jgi:hypothetical protein
VFTSRRHKKEWRKKVNLFLTTTPDGGDVSVSATEKQLQYLLNRKLGRPQADMDVSE